MNKVLIIAEAGVNHNADMAMAKKLIDVAKEAGADVVKFQTAVPELVMTETAEKAVYQVHNTGIKNESQLDMAKKIHLPLDAYAKLQQYAKEVGIKFLSTPFDNVSVQLLYDIGLDIFKIPSGEITNLPYLRMIGKMNKEVIISTGMCWIGEIEDALNVLIEAGTDRKNITVLQCNTDYPTKMSDVNLRAMTTIANAFNVKVGYSDHTLGIEIPVAAVALGAAVIEKHFTLDKSLEGPDHIASLDPQELKAMITAIRNVEHALGSSIKMPSESEKINMSVMRKSIVASRDIEKGEVFSEENLIVKRPGSGINPMYWDMVIGRTANKEYKRDTLISL